MFYISTRSTLLASLLILSLVTAYVPFEVFNTRSVPEARADITTGLVGHWTFDNTTQDSSGQGNHGAAQGGPTFTTGKINQAISLDGTDGYIELTNVGSLVSPTTGTIAFWTQMQTTITGNEYLGSMIRAVIKRF